MTKKAEKNLGLISLSRVERTVLAALESNLRPRVVPHLDGEPIQTIKRVPDSNPLRVDVACAGQQHTLTAIADETSTAIHARTAQQKVVCITFEPAREPLPITQVLVQFL